MRETSLYWNKAGDRLFRSVCLRGGFDPQTGSYANLFAHFLPDQHNWADDLIARYLELTGTLRS